MRRAPRLAALALLATACGEDPPPPTGDARVEVAGYDYDVDLVAGTAKSVVTVRLLDPGNCVTLASRAMIDLATVTLGGEPATATTTDTQLTACGTGWEVGTELALATDVTLATVTWGQSQVGYTIRDDGGGGAAALPPVVGRAVRSPRPVRSVARHLRHLPLHRPPRRRRDRAVPRRAEAGPDGDDLHVHPSRRTDVLDLRHRHLDRVADHRPG
jgi:hypothetical protein